MIAAILPNRAGIGLRAEHYVDLLERRPAVGFIEVHSENYFGGGGRPMHYLEQARRDYPLSLHGVGMSIGSTDALSRAHLKSLRALIHRVEPAVVSDHLCWTSVGGTHANDLLPLPYTRAALDHVVGRVQRVQEYLGRSILLENVSSYFEYADSVLLEAQFIAEVAQRSGCGILLDVNNVFVSAHNHRFDPLQYLEAIPRQMVAQIHLAGFIARHFDDGDILIDTHSRLVAPAVWALYEHALQRFGPVPTLIEWDAELPPLATLVGEAHRADALMAGTAGASNGERAA
jgi:uncharacterized protein